MTNFSLSLRSRALITLLALGLLIGALTVKQANAASESTVRGEISNAKGREAKLSGTVAKLADMETKARKAADVAAGRLAEVQSEFDTAQAKLNTTDTQRAATAKRLQRLKKRLATGRKILAKSLVASYTEGKPGLIDVVVSARGFDDLLDRVELLKHVQNADQKIIKIVAASQKDAARDRLRLNKLRKQQAAVAAQVADQKAAVASMAEGLQSRKETIQAAKQAKLDALSSARSDRVGAEKTLAKLQQAQAKAAKQYTSPATTSAAASSAGSSAGGSNGKWAIPWSIVQCESGGTNHLPNSAGASGYYQFMPATWKGLGGSTAHAYQASKAEQDRLAAKLWNNGAGAGNWDCTAIVGWG